MKRWLVAIPVLLAFWANACFTYNHFNRGPFLLDSGWYSAIIYRSGFFPPNPELTTGLHDYFQIHVSFVVSLASLLSYAFPGDRVDWYELFQGLAYVPCALAVPLLFRRHGAFVALVTLLFAFNGQTAWCMVYPHYEILIPGGVCLMLAGLAAGRLPLAWGGAALAVLAREDGGFHVASFAVAALAGASFPVPRRRLWELAIATLAASVFCFLLQKLVFHSEGLFRDEYIGTPAFAHLRNGVGWQRLVTMTKEVRFVLFPLAGTVAIAIATRDARYLLGWAVELPWLLLNLFAKQELKSVFSSYTGFPFVASMFWVGAYGARARGDAYLGAVALLAACGLASSVPGQYTYLWDLAAWPKPVDRGALLRVARAIRKDPKAFGNVYVDESLASWTLESIRRADVAEGLDANRPHPDGTLDARDGVFFFLTSNYGRRMLNLLGHSSMPTCGELQGTSLFFCTREGRALPAGFAPASPFLAETYAVPGATMRENERLVVRASQDRQLAIFGPFAELSAGRWRVSWDVKQRECVGSSRLGFDVFASMQNEVVAQLTADGPVDIDLTVTDAMENKPIETRVWTGACAYEIRDLRLRALP